MARTTTRAQMLIGMMLEELKCILGNFEEWTPCTVNDRSYGKLMEYADYMLAKSVVESLLKREITKNMARQNGAWAGSMDVIDQDIQRLTEKAGIE